MIGEGMERRRRPRVGRGWDAKRCGVKGGNARERRAQSMLQQFGYERVSKGGCLQYSPRAPEVLFEMECVLRIRDRSAQEPHL